MEITDKDRQYMRMACQLAYDNIDAGGGPFGAVIVDAKGEIIATGVNTVTNTNDPTAHAEVNAIRAACKRLSTFQLAGATIYSSCEPCPMCLSACYWAGVARLFYGNTKEDADAIDFSDNFIYQDLAKPYSARRFPQVRIDDAANIRAFERWASHEEKTPY